MPKSSRTLRDPGRSEASAPGPQVSVVQLPAGGAPAGSTTDSTDYRRYLLTLRKRWPLAVTVALLVVLGFAVHSLRQPKLYRASATLSIETTTPQVLTGVAEVVPVSTGWWDQEGFYEREYLVLQGREVARAAALRLGLVPETPGQDVADLVMGRFSLDPDRKAKGVVRIAVVDEEPTKTAEVANAVAEAYAEYNLERRVDGTKEAGTWLGLQHRDLKRKLELSEDALYQFMQDNDVLNASLESQLAEVMQRLSAFNGQLAGVQAERIRGRLEREALEAAKDDPRLLDSLA
ncbi:MAG: hypothetical protein ACO3JL_20845, partial [Myxococcota bacterium]